MKKIQISTILHASVIAGIMLTAAGCTYLTLYETGAVTMDFSQSEIRITTYLSR